MKKNIFSVIIAALTVINVILTAIMFFVMLPTFQKTNNLITQVASVLNLELDQEDSEGAQDYTLKDLEQYSVAFESQQTLNLVQLALRTMKSRPSLPRTLTISCGSLTAPTTPWVTATFAKLTGVIIELSICTCASVRPGR